MAGGDLDPKFEALRADVGMAITMLGAILLAAEIGEGLGLTDAVEMLRKNAQATTDTRMSAAMLRMAEHFALLHSNYEPERRVSQEH